jgi:exodeoxyribonuclease V
MIHLHISELIQKSFQHEPTGDQLKLIEVLSLFVTRAGEPKVLMVKGYAGTGKTSLLASLVQILPRFNIPFILLAPTGRAAKVLSQYSGMPAFTIHKKIYRQKFSRDGFGEFSLDRNLASNTLFIVDEASMIGNESSETSYFGTGNLLKDLVQYVYNGKNCQLIVIGDTAQLPPVGTDLSPALDPNTYRWFDLDVQEVFLREVVRQSSRSGILSNATTLRNTLENKKQGYPAIELTGFTDVKRISGAEIIEEISTAYAKSDVQDTIVICRSNKQANKYNEGIRRQILGREEEISVGDLLMVVRNNYFWLKEGEVADFIANGDILRVKRIRRYDERYGLRFADITAVFPDYKDVELDVKVLLDTLSLDGASLSMELNKEFYQSVLSDYQDLQTKKKQLDAIRMDPFFNALQVKFAYAVTCHKAQGGQWQNVFVDQGWIDEKKTPELEYLRWLYTAFTRARERIYLVNFKDHFFS